MVLINRETSTFPVSIGTALAFEGLVGIHPNQPKQLVNNKTINEIWVNLRTLVRNLYSAVPTGEVSTLDPNASINLLYEELKLLPDLLRQNGLNIKVVPYVAPLIEIEYMFPKAAYKRPRTPKQIAYRFYEDYVSEGLHELLKSSGDELLEIGRKPAKNNKNVALLTHFPHELLWKDLFSRLLLLESHTGKIKPHQEWYTKLHALKADSRPLPFNRFTLQVFGDNVVINSQPKNIRSHLLQLAIERKWSPVTTQDKFYHDITTYGTKELKENYRLLR